MNARESLEIGEVLQQILKCYHIKFETGFGSQRK